MVRILILLTLIPLAGCHLLTRDRTGHCLEPSEYSRSFDEAHTRCLAEKRALNALGACYPHAEVEFKYGFVQAYVDIALGSDGQLPAVPPERFWKSCNRHPDGHCNANHWFAGYAAGAERALASCWNAYNVVPAGGLCHPGNMCCDSNACNR